MNADKLARRRDHFMPNGIPKNVRCYDNGGPEAGNGTVDRYTVVYTGRAATERSDGRPSYYPFVCMSASPFHPQGVGMHDSNPCQPVDTIREDKPGWNWPPAVGRRCLLGKRVRFEELPADCQRLVRNDYEEIWRLRPEDWKKGRAA